MFVLKEDGSLIPLKPAQFAAEADFQQLLARYPELLAGELIHTEEPRKWLLVAREVGIPGEQDGSDLWSADHLFLDQDGIPTIVEVKRQTDTRLRREVVAQMLDYAANGAAFWTAESIRLKYEATCAKQEKAPDQELQERLGPEFDSVKFWERVKTNLEAQRLRLLFVADSIPRELRRIVEFLNRQMNPVEVLALELRQYSGENGLRTLAPTLFGQTEEARLNKSSGSSRDWDESSWFEELTLRSTPPAEIHCARKILAWMKQNSSRVVYGHGKIDGSITTYCFVGKAKFYPLTLSTQGKVFINFPNCTKAPFDAEEKRQAWLDLLNSIPEVKLPSDSLGRFPYIPLGTLAADTQLDKFLSVMDWFIAELKS